MFVTNTPEIQKNIKKHIIILLKMKSELVQGPIKFPIDIDLEKMIITSPNMNLEIKIYHEDEQGFYVDYQNQVYRLEYNPISKIIGLCI